MAGGEDVTLGGDVTLVAHTRKVVVCVPMMVDGNISGEGGIARCTPGGTAPPLRPSPHRPPGVVYMNLPRREKLAIHGPWNGEGHA